MGCGASARAIFASGAKTNVVLAITVMRSCPRARKAMTAAAEPSSGVAALGAMVLILELACPETAGLWLCVTRPCSPEVPRSADRLHPASGEQLSERMSAGDSGTLLKRAHEIPHS